MNAMGYTYNGSIKDRTASVEARAAMSEAAVARWQRPGFREQVADSMRARWQDPDYRARVTASRRGLKRSAEARERMRRASHRRYHEERGVVKPGCPFCGEREP